MTKFLTNILEQPRELLHALSVAAGRDWQSLEKAARLLRAARNLYISGMGSSWHAGLALGCLLQSRGIPASAVEASELLHFGQIAPDSVVVLISRSGQSIEIIKLLDKALDSGAKVIGITNSADSPLAGSAHILLVPECSFDYLISVKTYTSIALMAGLLVYAVSDEKPGPIIDALIQAFNETHRFIDLWRELITESQWFQPDMPTYFLARGPSVASCHEARLLWEEGAKSPAAAMTTSAFRHGPLEIVQPGIRFGVWIDSQETRDLDLATVDDIRRLGGVVMAVGHELDPDSSDLVLPLPRLPRDFEYVIDIIPAQLACEHLARQTKIDCDTFRVCSYVVETEGGLGFA